MAMTSMAMTSMAMRGRRESGPSPDSFGVEDAPSVRFRSEGGMTGAAGTLTDTVAAI